MELNIESKLDNTRNLLEELGNAVSSLVNSSPDIFEDQSIKSHLKDFLNVYQEAVQIKARTTIATTLHWEWALVTMSLLFSRERTFFSFLPSIHFVLSQVCYCPSEAPTPSRLWSSSFCTHFSVILPSSHNHLHFSCLIVSILLLFGPTDPTAGQSHRS